MDGPTAGVSEHHPTLMKKGNDSMTNQMPPPMRELHGRKFSKEEAQKTTAKALNLTPAMEDTTRTTEYRKRVAGWTPIVKVLGDQKLRVAVVGRMNSGKSSLYNLLAKQDVPMKNLVQDYEGITRDTVEAHAELGNIAFTIIDTPGLVKGKVIE